jgi:polyphosphate kinase
LTFRKPINWHIQFRWAILGDGSSQRIVRRSDEKPFNAQTYFLANPSSSGRGEALAGSFPRNLADNFGKF